MITAALMNAGTGVASWIASLFPVLTLPDWFTGFGATFNGFFASFNGLGAWAPWTLLAGCLSLSLSVWAACALLKLGRALISYLPFIGGAG